jgi:signal transduction histidine kinase
MMTGLFALDWMMLSVSLFNAILLTWLGLMVIFSADRQHWGVWMMGGGLLMGALFFISHTAILGHGAEVITDGLNFWWQVGWLPLMLTPFAWYGVIIWYARAMKRHRLPLALMSVVCVLMIAVMLICHPLPSYNDVAMLRLNSTLMLGDVPLMFIAFPLFMVLCILMSIDALLHPSGERDEVQQLGWQRARGWLLGTAYMLLGVSLLVITFIAGVVIISRLRIISLLDIFMIGMFDLMLSVMIAGASILVGQAVVSYEVFTGKIFPRQGFFHDWRNIILLAAGYAVVIGWGLVLQLRPVYVLMLVTLLMVVYMALSSWRSFAKRESQMARLRPFVASPQLTTQFISPEDQSLARAHEQFAAVCKNVLDTERAYLIPQGMLASLVDTPLAYPAAFAGKSPPIPTELEMDVLPLQNNELSWAVPLWSERGKIGALLIGRKRGGGVYTQEEIEIARATGERIIDLLATESMARRLMSLQRKRFVEQRVMDLRARRLLHDETLPALHTAALYLNGVSQTDTSVQKAVNALMDVHRQISDLIHSAQSNIPMTNGDLTASVRQLVEREFSEEFQTVTWKICDALPTVDGLVEEIVLGAVREVIRNAALHGRGGDSHYALCLDVEFQCAENINIILHDNGVGVRQTVEKSDVPKGSGGGLLLHSTMLALIGGYLHSESSAGQGTTVKLTFPT